MAKYTIGWGVSKGKCFFSQSALNYWLVSEHLKEGAGGHDELVGKDDHTEEGGGTTVLAKIPTRLWSLEEVI